MLTNRDLEAPLDVGGCGGYVLRAQEHGVYFGVDGLRDLCIGRRDWAQSRGVKSIPEVRQCRLFGHKSGILIDRVQGRKLIGPQGELDLLCRADQEGHETRRLFGMQAVGRKGELQATQARSGERSNADLVHG